MWICFFWSGLCWFFSSESGKAFFAFVGRAFPAEGIKVVNDFKTLTGKADSQVKKTAPCRKNSTEPPAFAAKCLFRFLVVEGKYHFGIL